MLHLLNTVQKKTSLPNLIKGGGVPSLPPIYADLKLWFPDTSLSNPSSNNFEWLDIVSGTIKVTGNYGTGTGVGTILNGKNGLFTTGGTSTISTPVLNYPAYTFFGILSKTTVNTNRVCHFLTRASTDFTLMANYNSGGVNKGITIYGYYASTSRLALEILTGVDWSTPILVIYRFSFGNPINGKLWCQNQVATDTAGIMVQSACDMNINKGNYLLTNSYDGALGEFMYYGKALSDAEINLVIDWYNSKYGVTFMNHI